MQSQVMSNPKKKSQIATQLQNRITILEVLFMCVLLDLCWSVVILSQAIKKALILHG